MSKVKHPEKRSLLFEAYNCCKMVLEYYKGILKFRDISPCITVYGSARLHEDTKEYQATKELANALTQAGYNIITGGGPGIMQAANEGCYNSSNGKSAGCSIFIPHETFSNPYLNFHHHCNYFFIRKVLLTRFSSGFIAMPGGIGTLDELFEMLTLIKTHRISDFPVILFDSEFWRPMMEFMQTKMLELGTVNEQEIDWITVTDDIQTVVDTIKKYHND